MMTKRKAKEICKFWNGESRFHGATDKTKTTCVLVERNKLYQCEIIPDGYLNNGETFYCVEGLALVAKFFNCSCFITIQDGVQVGHIF